jgi:GT2 family glycosyltransferase
MTAISVTIIIPAHEHSGMTAHCVDSVFRSLGSRRDVEVIVIDDASTPPIDLSDIVDHRLRLERSDTNLRFAGACNRGAELARGELLVFLNSDTEVRDGWLEAMVKCSSDNPRAGVIGARLAYRDGTTQHAGMCFSQSDGMPRHLYRGFPITHPVVQRDRDVQSVTGACLLIAKKLFTEIGGFDVEYTNGFEDVDLCLRVGALGWTVTSCGATEIVHLESVSIRPSATPETGTANAALFARKWLSDVKRDEIDHYIADDLIRLVSDDVYPLSLHVAPELAIVPGEITLEELARLLNIRSRQVFDLEKEIGYLTAKLLDNGIEP